MTVITPTPEQEAIVAAVRDTTNSVMVTAYAGCAKTTTLEMIAQSLPVQPALALAFNVRIKKELEKRFPGHFEVKTLNGLGHSAWQRAIGKRCEVDEKKLGKLVTQVSREQGFELDGDQWNDVRQIVTCAMLAGLVPSTFPHQGLVPDTLDHWADIADQNFLPTTQPLLALARDILIQSVKLGFKGQISFDDQIYLSAIYNGVFPRFPLVMVDEAQDLSPLNHIQVKRTAAGRLIVVGDPKQSVYAFRGADHESMGKLKALRKDWITLPLATTFRCPQIIVQRQQDHAPGFRAWASNVAGIFVHWKESVPHGDTSALEGWSKEKLLECANGHGSIAILCRNNAPLLGIAFKLLRQQVSCVMLGRDIGKGLIALSKKILPDNFTPTEDCIRLVRDWINLESQLALANGKDEKIAGITDRGECLIAVAESAPDISNAADLRSALDRLFARDTGKVTLSTGHRAKGLEWDVVLHLDPWRIPSKYAKRSASAGDERQLQQELNLNYVIETRAKHTLILANLEDFT